MTDIETRAEALLKDTATLTFAVRGTNEPARRFLAEAPGVIAGLLEALQDLRTRGVVPEHDCTCGSGGHPRWCDKHPHFMQMHIDDLNRDNEIEDLRADLTAAMKTIAATEALMGDHMYEHTGPDLSITTRLSLPEAVRSVLEALAAETAERRRLHCAWNETDFGKF